MRSPQRQSLLASIKTTLLTWNKRASTSVGSGDNYKRYLEEFTAVLTSVFPKEVAFDGIEFNRSEILFNFGQARTPLECVSGGMTSLVHLSWMLYTCGDGNPYTALIDEVENHLHPSLQRLVLPALVEAFPHVQFIVATHSPLVVNSVRDARIYALRFNEARAVVSEELDFSLDAKTAAEILNRVLEVPVTIPQWAEREFQIIVDRYLRAPAEQLDFAKFTHELEAHGLANFALRGMSEVLGRRK